MMELPTITEAIGICAVVLGAYLVMILMMLI